MRLIFLLAALLLLAAPGFADDSLSLGVQAYNAHRYSQALSYFAAAAAKAPSDPSVHYYMGLAYQGINQITLAKQQYSWVAQQTANPALATQARLALAQLSKYTTSHQPQSQTPHQSVKQTGAPKIASAAQAPLVGRARVIEFYTDW